MIRRPVLLVGATITVLSSVSVRAEVPPESQRTVAWYTAHPAERDRIRRFCLNDPGHLQGMPDCINASKAELEAVAATARGRAGNSSDPNSPAYWTSRPGERSFKLGFCKNMTMAQQIAAGCAPAQESLRMERASSSR